MHERLTKNRERNRFYWFQIEEKVDPHIILLYGFILKMMTKEVDEITS